MFISWKEENPSGHELRADPHKKIKAKDSKECNGSNSMGYKLKEGRFLCRVYLQV